MTLRKRTFELQLLTKKIRMLVYIVFIAKIRYCYEDTRLNLIVFQNPHLTSRVFIKEQSDMVTVKRLSKSLKQMGNILISKLILSARYKAHPKYIFHSIVKGVDLFKNGRTLSNIQRFYTVLQQCKNQPSLCQYDFGMSTKDVIHGARKGILILYDTYKPNMATFSKGIINPKDLLKCKSRKIDRLAADDTASISIIAIDEFHWFHTSTIFWKETYNILKDWNTNILKKTISALIHEYRSYFTLPIYNKHYGGNEYRNMPSIDQGISRIRPIDTAKRFILIYAFLKNIPKAVIDSLIGMSFLLIM